MAGLPEGFGERLRMPGPVLHGNPANRDAAVLAVIRPVEIEVALDLPEKGQHAVPVPAGGAARFPFVVVGRCAAVGHLAVDRRAAAQHARLFVFAQRRAGFVRIVVADDLGRDLEFGPVEARIEIGRARIAVANFGRLVAGRGVLAGFAEQNLVGAFGGKPVGHDRACRPAADDDEVVQWMFPRSLCREASPAWAPGHASGRRGSAAVVRLDARRTCVHMLPAWTHRKFISSPTG